MLYVVLDLYLSLVYVLTYGNHPILSLYEMDFPLNCDPKSDLT